MTVALSQSTNALVDLWAKSQPLMSFFIDLPIIVTSDPCKDRKTIREKSQNKYRITLVIL